MFVRSFAAMLLVALFVFGFASGHAYPAAAGDTGEQLQGDVTCDSSVNAIDSLQILRDVAGLGTAAQCLADAGDVNCDSAVNSVDSLRILRYVAGLANTTADGCAPIGEPLQPPPTSEELIAAALEAGDIEYPESLLERAYALFDDPRLQNEFRSPIIDYEAAIPLFGEIETNRAQLSQGLLDQLAPFMARPNDPISIFNNPPTQSAVSAAPEVPWRSLPAGTARVWMKATSDAALSQYVAAVSKVWTAFNGVFPYPKPDEAGLPSAQVNPDTAIDFYFVDKATVDPREAYCVDHPNYVHCSIGPNRGGYAGRAPKIEDNKSSGYVMLGTDFTGDTLLAGMAHELMHVSQFAYDKDENFWLMDATAHWGADRVMAKIPGSRNYLYQDLGEFFKTLDEPLSRDVGNNRYSAFTYFLFASMQKGDGIVTKVWEKAAAAGEQNVDAADQAFKFGDNFDDFAVLNWNQKPPLVTTYRDGDDTFPNGLKPKLAEPNKFFAAGGEHNLTTPVKNLASLYYSYTFGSDVRRVRFFNNYYGLPSAHVWAIKQVAGVWKEPEDWTGELVKEFCRDQSDEDLTGLILIVSNSHMKDALPAPDDPAYVKADTLGCKGWSGTVSMTFNLASDGETILETAETQARFELDEELSLPGSPDKYWLPIEGAVNWNHKRTGECHGQFAGGFSIRAKDAGGNKLGSLSISDQGEKWDDGQPKLRYWAYGVTPTEDIPLNFYDCDDPDAPPLPVIYLGFGAGGWLQTDPFNGYVSKDGKTLSGSYTVSTGDASTRWQWQFTYHGE